MPMKAKPMRTCWLPGDGVPMSENGSSTLDAAISQIPRGLYIVTASADGHRSAILAHWIQQCASDPPMVMVALEKGQPIEPLIRDSRSFAICQVGADDRFLQRKFGEPHGRGEDPFISLAVRETNCGPIIERAMSYLECVVERHVELDSDFRLYVGRVVDGALLEDCSPAVFYGSAG